MLFGLMAIALGSQPLFAQEGSFGIENFQGKKRIHAALDSSIHRVFSNGVWKNVIKEVYMYTQSGNLYRKEKHTWSVADTNWKISSFFSYAYDVHGKLESEVEMGRFQTTWDTLQIKSISYNANNLPTSETVDKWSTISNKFYRYSFRNLAYNAQGLLVLDSNFFSNDEGVNYTGIKYDFGYRSTGQLESRVESYKFTVSWDIRNKMEYEYNAQDTLVARHYYSYAPSTQDWLYNARAEYLVDTMGNISRQQTFQNTDSATYTPFLRLDGDYDNSIPISNVAFPYLTQFEVQPQTLLNTLVYTQYNKTSMVWDSISFISFYYTKINTGIKEASMPLFALYPNPANQIVTIQTEEEGDYTLQVYNLQGALVQESKFNGLSQRMDIQSLAPGAYVIALGKEGYWYRQKFVKQ